MCRAGGKQIWINFSYFLLSWDRKLRIYSRKSCLQEVKKFLPKVTAHCWLFVHTYCISLFIHRLQKAIRQPRHCVSSSSSNYDWLICCYSIDIPYRVTHVKTFISTRYRLFTKNWIFLVKMTISIFLDVFASRQISSTSTTEDFALNTNIFLHSRFLRINGR